MPRRGQPCRIFHSARVSPNGAAPALSVTLNSQTTIRTLELVPPAPVAQQSYVATVDVFCLKADSKVTISVQGTDGYSNSRDYDINVTQGDGQFTLTVPGAATAGIRDLVTVKISLPDGTVLTRTAALVFGQSQLIFLYFTVPKKHSIWANRLIAEIIANYFHTSIKRSDENHKGPVSI